jgi:CYTH domain-containing protein
MGNFLIGNALSTVFSENNNKNYLFKIETECLSKNNLVEIEDKIISFKSNDLKNMMNKIIDVLNYYIEYNNEIYLNEVDFFYFNCDGFNILEIKNTQSPNNKSISPFLYRTKVCDLKNLYYY